jgi:hypothetical protein
MICCLHGIRCFLRADSFALTDSMKYDYRSFVLRTLIIPFKQFSNTLSQPKIRFFVELIVSFI